MTNSDNEDGRELACGDDPASIRPVNHRDTQDDADVNPATPRRGRGRPRLYDPDEDWETALEYVRKHPIVPGNRQFVADGLGALYARLRRHPQTREHGTVGRALSAATGLPLDYPRRPPANRG